MVSFGIVALPKSTRDPSYFNFKHSVFCSLTAVFRFLEFFYVLFFIFILFFEAQSIVCIILQFSIFNSIKNHMCHITFDPCHVTSCLKNCCVTQEAGSWISNLETRTAELARSNSTENSRGSLVWYLIIFFLRKTLKKNKNCSGWNRISLY